MSKIKIQFGVPSFDQKEIDAITAVIKSGWVGFGKKSLEFESNFSFYIKSRYSKSVNSCTSALHTCLELLNIGEGDHVITTPLTFAATVRAIELSGATPVLVDIDPNTFNIDCTKLESAISNRTKAILPVHFGGMPCDMELIYKIAKKRGLYVVEDAAHALGAEFDNKKIGSSTKSLTCFSFYPNKNITTIEGGMITTSNKKYSDKIDIIRMMGQSTGAWQRFAKTKTYSISEVIDKGYKYNMTDINAAVGIVQLSKLHKFLLIRERHAKIYDNILGPFKHIIIQKRTMADHQVRHALHLYPIVLKGEMYRFSREKIVNKIREKGIGVVVHYKPIQEHLYFKNKYNFPVENLKNSEYVGRNIISLPLGPAFNDEEIYSAAKTILEVLESSLI
jgi:dTDP-4-amino-4,6-dideoxygalactose transaminase